MKKNIIALSIFIIISAIVLVFGERIYDTINAKYFNTNIEDDFLFGSKTGEHGKISLKIRLDKAGIIKEVMILEHPDNEVAPMALQKLINSSLDKQSVDEIDAVSGATETTDVYKGIISKLISNNSGTNDDETNEKILLSDKTVAESIERKVYNPEGLKSGVGGYIINSFQDADYGENGSLATNEYVCAVVINNRNRIEDVKFDHIASNISFDRYGKVPTGGAKAYPFLSDKAKPGFNGLINDGNYIDIGEFENSVCELKYFEDVKTKYINKKGYAPFIFALENAIDNARFIGATSGDTLGLSAYKLLKKSDIKDATDDENGTVNFKSNYALVTVDKNKNITSVMFDNVSNVATLMSDGKILGSRDKEIYTLNELSNTEKYSKIDASKYILKVQLNALADILRGNDIDTVLSMISQSTDNSGYALKDGPLYMLDSIDFIELIDIITNSYIDAVRIRK